MTRSVSNSLCSSLELPVQLAAKICYWFISPAVFFHLPTWSLRRRGGRASPDWLWERRRGRQTVFIRDDLLLCCRACFSCCSSLWSNSPPLPPGWAAADVCSTGVLKETTSLCSNYQSQCVVLTGLTNLLSLFLFKFPPAVLSVLSPPSKEQTLGRCFIFRALSVSWKHRPMFTIRTGPP